MERREWDGSVYMALTTAERRGKVDILAKSQKKKRNLKIETLAEHIVKTVYACQRIGKEVLDENFMIILTVLCVVHDLGKISAKMQQKLRLANLLDDETDENARKELKKKIRNVKNIRHNILTGTFLKAILDKLNVSYQDRVLIYKSVLLHHGCYEDYCSISYAKIQEEIYEDIEKAVYENDEFTLSDVEKIISNELSIEFKFNAEELDYDYMHYMSEHFERDSERIKYMLYKGFLNLADHVASSQIDEFTYYNPFDNKKIDDMLKSNIAEKLSKTGKQVVQKSNIQFTEVQDNIRKLGCNNVLTVAFTGSGKTVGDYRKNFRRKFYLVPNKISAESFYNQSIFQEEKYIGILHGDINLYANAQYSENELALTLKDISLTRNFCKPYIIATVDQVLLSMFKYPGYEKVFAALYGASITVDEVHLLEPRMFLILIYFIQFADKNLNVNFHLMTATLPKAYKEKMMEKNIEVLSFKDFENNRDKSPENKIIFVESAPDAETSSENNLETGKKIKVEFIKESKMLNIVENAVNQNKKVLIIKNTIDEANETYGLLEKSFKDIEINVLHSRFKHKDKSVKYEKILKQEGNVWISTQSVEIALDLDFPVIISDLAHMDCLIQRMGRCNRHDTCECGEFYILPDKNDVYDEKLKEIAKKLLSGHIKKNKDGILFMSTRKELLEKYYEHKDVNKYFEDEFRNGEEDIKGIYGMATNDYDGEKLILNFEPYKNIANNKREAAKLFRNVDISYRVVLQEDYDRILSDDSIEEKTIEIQLNSIQISKGIYYKLKSKNQMQIKNGYILINDKDAKNIKYDEKTGLIVE